LIDNDHIWISVDSVQPAAITSSRIAICVFGVQVNTFVQEKQSFDTVALFYAKTTIQYVETSFFGF
jgi:hypothetical protein